MHEKEKDLEHLKYNLNKLQKRFNEKEEELESMKANNIEIENITKILTGLTEELKIKFDKDLQILTHQNESMKIKIDSLQSELLETKTMLQTKNAGTLFFKRQVENIKSDLAKKMDSYVKKVDNLFDFDKELLPMLSNEVVSSKEIINIITESRLTRRQLDKSLDIIKNEINELSSRVAATEKSIEDNIENIDIRGMKKINQTINFPHNAIAEKKDILHTGITNKIVWQVPSMHHQILRPSMFQYPYLLKTQPRQDYMPVVVQLPLTIAFLSTFPVKKQKQMIGDRLFPLIHPRQPHLAGKITGMLLQLPNIELLDILSSAELLSRKIDASIFVLQNCTSTI